MRAAVTAITLRALLDAGWKQPDQRSCGGAVLVLAEAVGNAAYARWLLDGGSGRYAAEVLSMHRRVTGPADVRGHLQAPWPRALGTPPWAVSRQLAGRTGLPHRTVHGDAHTLHRSLVTASHDVHPAALYVGSRTLPRHVLLSVPREVTGLDEVVVHDPATGRLRPLPHDHFVGGTLTPGWPRPWCVVAPLRQEWRDVRTRA